MDVGEVYELVPVRQLPDGALFYHYGSYYMKIDLTGLGFLSADFITVVNMKDGKVSRIHQDDDVRFMSRAKLLPEG